MDRRADIIGWHHTPFGRLAGETVESLVATAAHGAIESAGVAPGEIDEVCWGTSTAGSNR